VSARARVPADTESTKWAYFRSMIGSGTAVVGWAIGAAIVFTLGAAAHSVAVVLGGPVAVALVVLVVCYVRADSKAEDEFFNRFAQAHGMTHSPKWSLYELTPLLGGGDRRHCEHWMEGDGRGIGWYTFEVREDNGDQRDTWEPHHFTIAMTDLGELGMSRFQGIYVRRRRGVFERMDTDANWLGGRGCEKVELESTAFNEKFELWIDKSQDPIVLRQLFAPSFIVWMSEHPLACGFELRAGTLVVFLPGHCGEAGKLEWLLMAARDISRRIQAELTEAAQARSL
jgi:hypothetical protein